MKQFWIQIFALLLVVFGALYLTFNQDTWQSFIPGSGNANLDHTRIKINETIINIEVADTAAERNRGLSSRESLAADSGMLFVFDKPKQTQFWMKGMRFALDMIFIRDGKVVDILRNVPPPEDGQKDDQLPLYQPVTEIDMMLEVPAGFADSRNIQIGDTVFLVSNNDSSAD